MIMELCGGGELYEYVMKVGRLDEVDAREIFSQLCSACAYFHNRGVIHRDLKLENVLFKRKPTSDLTVKIVDFGIAGSSNPNKDGDKSNAGSLSYMPPEVLDNSCTQAKPSIDVWALGAILFALIMGRLPFHGHTPEEQLEKINQFTELGTLNFNK